MPLASCVLKWQTVYHRKPPARNPIMRTAHESAYAKKEKRVHAGLVQFFAPLRSSHWYKHPVWRNRTLDNLHTPLVVSPDRTPPPPPPQEPPRHW